MVQLRRLQKNWDRRFCAWQMARPSRGLDDHFEYDWLLNKVDFFNLFFYWEVSSTLNERSDVMCRAEFYAQNYMIFPCEKALPTCRNVSFVQTECKTLEQLVDYLSCVFIGTNTNSAPSHSYWTSEQGHHRSSWNRWSENSIGLTIGKI